MTDETILPESQAFSDKLMAARYVALELKKAILEAQNAMLVLQNKLMADPNIKIMSMDTGDMEAAMFRVASQHGEVKSIHKMANDLGRKLGVKMPAAPTYDSEYLELVNGSVNVKLSSLARR
jgi:hypothetical protein